MNWLRDFSNSSIGRKMQVAAAGLLLCAYLVIHLFGNLFVYGGSEVYNKYAEVMESNPVLPAIELALLAVFLIHIVGAVTTTVKNMKARPVRYEARAPQSTLSARLMPLSGVVLVAFLLVHVRAFRFLRFAMDGGHDLYGFETGLLSSKPMAAFYLVGLAALFPHLKHGFQSAFNTLGFNHPRYTCSVKVASTVFALVIVGGFMSIALYLGFIRGAA